MEETSRANRQQEDRPIRDKKFSKAFAKEILGQSFDSNDAPPIFEKDISPEQVEKLKSSSDFSLQVFGNYLAWKNDEFKNTGTHIRNIIPNGVQALAQDRRMPQSISSKYRTFLRASELDRHQMLSILDFGATGEITGLLYHRSVLKHPDMIERIAITRHDSQHKALNFFLSEAGNNPSVFTPSLIGRALSSTPNETNSHVVTFIASGISHNLVELSDAQFDKLLRRDDHYCFNLCLPPSIFRKKTRPDDEQMDVLIGRTEEHLSWHSVSGALARKTDWTLTPAQMEKLFFKCTDEQKNLLIQRDDFHATEKIVDWFFVEKRLNNVLFLETHNKITYSPEQLEKRQTLFGEYSSPRLEIINSQDPVSFKSISENESKKLVGLLDGLVNENRHSTRPT